MVKHQKVMIDFDCMTMIVCSKFYLKLINSIFEIQVTEECYFWSETEGVSLAI